MVVNFTNVDNYLRGCGPLDGQWRLDKPAAPGGSESGRVFIGAPGFDGSPSCEANMYAPEGEALADIVNKFADDHDEWAETFFDAWEKMQLNGYDPAQLTESPANGNLLSNVRSPNIRQPTPPPYPKD